MGRRGHSPIIVRRGCVCCGGDCLSLSLGIVGVPAGGQRLGHVRLVADRLSDRRFVLLGLGSVVPRRILRGDLVRLRRVAVLRTGFGLGVLHRFGPLQTDLGPGDLHRFGPLQTDFGLGSRIRRSLRVLVVCRGVVIAVGRVGHRIHARTRLGEVRGECCCGLRCSGLVVIRWGDRRLSTLLEDHRLSTLLEGRRLLDALVGDLVVSAALSPPAASGGVLRSGVLVGGVLGGGGVLVGGPLRGRVLVLCTRLERVGPRGCVPLVVGRGGIGVLRRLLGPISCSNHSGRGVLRNRRHVGIGRARPICLVVVHCRNVVGDCCHVIGHCRYVVGHWGLVVGRGCLIRGLGHLILDRVGVSRLGVTGLGVTALSLGWVRVRPLVGASLIDRRRLRRGGVHRAVCLREGARLPCRAMIAVARCGPIPGSECLLRASRLGPERGGEQITTGPCGDGCRNRRGGGKHQVRPGDRLLWIGVLSLQQGQSDRVLGGFGLTVRIDPRTAPDPYDLLGLSALLILVPRERHRASWTPGRGALRPVQGRHLHQGHRAIGKGHILSFEVRNPQVEDLGELSAFVRVRLRSGRRRDDRGQPRVRQRTPHRHHAVGPLRGFRRGGLLVSTVVGVGGLTLVLRRREVPVPLALALDNGLIGGALGLHGRTLTRSGDLVQAVRLRDRGRAVNCRRDPLRPRCLRFVGSNGVHAKPRRLRGAVGLLSDGLRLPRDRMKILLDGLRLLSDRLRLLSNGLRHLGDGLGLLGNGLSRLGG